MGQNIKNNGRGVNKLFSQLAAEKKKGVIALCLIGVMVFMWARMFGGKTPAGAEAALMSGAMSGGQSDSKLKISFIELPKVIGRNDVLTRDFFVMDGRGLSGTKAAEFVLEGDGEEAMRQVAEKLKLEATIMGENPQAVINDELLSVGDKLQVSDGGNTYECEVIWIEEGKAVIRCGETEITLKLMDTQVNAKK